MSFWNHVKSFMLAEEPKLENVNELPHENVDPESANRYPMRDAPIPVKDVDFIVASQAELIRRLSDAVPLSTEEFNRYLFPSIKRLAAFVHLLPASNNYHHKGRGGLFRHSLEVALFTVNSAKHHIFENNQVPAAAYYNKGRWFVACTIAALMHDIGKTILNVTVTGQNGTLQWHPLTSSLLDWATHHGLTEYYLVWKKEDAHYESHESVGASLLYPLVDQEALNFIVESNSRLLVTEFLESLSGIARPGAIIANLVKNADSLSTKRDVRHMSLDSKVVTGVDTPIAAILEDIMVQFIERGVWKANDWTIEKKAFPALWLTDEGAFLHWPVAVKDIIGELNRRGIASIPRDPLTLAEKLCEGGVCQILHPDVTAEVFWQMLPMKIVRPKVEEQLCAETGEIKKVFLDDNGSPYQYRFLQCVKIIDIKRFFAHKARPSLVTAVVISVPVNLEKMKLWRSKTQMQPPQTQMEEQDLTPDLIEEADRKALTQESNNQVFDHFGNPLPFMPTLGEEEWMDIEMNNSIAEMDGVNYNDIVKDDEPEKTIQPTQPASSRPLKSEEVNPVDWPGLSSQMAVNGTSPQGATITVNLTPKPLNPTTDLEEDKHEELLKDEKAPERVETTMGEAETPERKDSVFAGNEDDIPDDVWVHSITADVDTMDIEPTDEDTVNEEAPATVVDTPEREASTTLETAVDKEVSDERTALKMDDVAGTSSTDTPVTVTTLDDQFLASMVPKLESVHKKKTKRKKKDKKPSSVTPPPVEDKHPEKIETSNANDVVLMAEKPVVNEMNEACPLPSAIVNDPDFALLTFDDKPKLTFAKDSETATNKEEKGAQEAKSPSTTVKDIEVAPMDYNISRFNANLKRALIKQLEVGKGPLICLYAQEGNQRSTSCQKVRELLIRKGYNWPLFVHSIQENPDQLHFDEDHQQFFIEKATP